MFKKIDFLDLNNCNGGVGGMSLSNGTNHAHTNGNHHGSQGNLSRGINNKTMHTTVFETKMWQRQNFIR